MVPIFGLSCTVEHVQIWRKKWPMTRVSYVARVMLQTGPTGAIHNDWGRQACNRDIGTNHPELCRSDGGGGCRPV